MGIPPPGHLGREVGGGYDKLTRKEEPIPLGDSGKSVTFAESNLTVAKLTGGSGPNVGKISFSCTDNSGNLPKTFHFRIGENTPLFKQIQDLSSLSPEDQNVAIKALALKYIATLLKVKDAVGSTIKNVTAKYEGGAGGNVTATVKAGGANLSEDEIRDIGNFKNGTRNISQQFKHLASAKKVNKTVIKAINKKFAVDLEKVQTSDGLREFDQRIEKINFYVTGMAEEDLPDGRKGEALEEVSVLKTGLQGKASTRATAAAAAARAGKVANVLDQIRGVATSNPQMTTAAVKAALTSAGVVADGDIIEDTIAQATAEGMINQPAVQSAAGVGGSEGVVKPQAFVDLCTYIEEEYPDLPIADYTSISDLEGAGFPCHFAAQKGDLKLLKKLVLAGANPERKDGEGNTIYSAISARSNSVLKMKRCVLNGQIKKGDIQLNADFEDKNVAVALIRYATKQKDLAAMLPVLDTAGAGIAQWRDDQGKSLLHFIAESESDLDFSDIIAVLIKNECPVDAQDKFGRTPLYNATNRENKALIQAFLSKGADQNEKSNDRAGTTGLSPYRIAKSSYDAKVRLDAKKIPGKAPEAATFQREILSLFTADSPASTGSGGLTGQVVAPTAEEAKATKLAAVSTAIGRLAGINPQMAKADAKAQLAGNGITTANGYTDEIVEEALTAAVGAGQILLVAPPSEEEVKAVKVAAVLSAIGNVAIGNPHMKTAEVKESLAANGVVEEEDIIAEAIEQATIAGTINKPEPVDIMALENQYARDFGHKAANLMVLRDQLEGIPDLEDSQVAVPSFKGISHIDIHEHLSNAAGTRFVDLLTQFQRQQTGQAALTPQGKATLGQLRTFIMNTFETNHFMNAGVGDFLAEGSPATKLMVRSTGAEDTTEMANAGGNESYASVQKNPVEVSKFIGKVVASYFTDKSMIQRIGEGDDITQNMFMPVLLQEMVGERAGGVDYTRADDLQGIPVSGVMFSEEAEGRTQLVTQIQSTFGHGEGIVNSAMRVTGDTFFVGSDKTIHAVVRNKSERVCPIVGGLGKKENEGFSEQATLDPSIVRDLKRVADKIHKAYGMPMDIEFVVDKSGGANTINVVQARPIVHKAEGEHRHLKEGMIASFEASVTGAVVGAAGGNVHEIHNNKELIVADTLADALRNWQDRDDKGAVKAVVCREMAHTTSHEATQFRGLNIPVIACDDTETIQSWMSEGKKVVVDTQRGLLGSMDKGAEIETGDGWIEHPIPSSQSLYGATVVSNDFRDTLFDLIASEGTSKEALMAANDNQLTAHLKAQLKGHENDKIKEVIDTLKSREADPIEKKKALAVLLLKTYRLYRQKSEDHATSGDDMTKVLGQVTQQMLAASKEIVQALKPDAVAEADKKFMSLLYGVNFLEGMISQSGRKGILQAESLRTVKSEAKNLEHTEELLAARNLKLSSENKMLFGQMLKFEKMALKEEVKTEWRDFLVSTFEGQNDHKIGRLTGLASEIHKLGLGDHWLNKSFMEQRAATSEEGLVNITRSRKDLLALSAKFEADRGILSEVMTQRNKIEQWQAKIPEWDQPDSFEERFNVFNAEFVTPMMGLLARMDTAESLGKVALINMLKEGVEVYDRSIKSISGSPTLLPAQKIACVKRMLDPYYRMTRSILENIPDGSPLQPLVAQYLDEMQQIKSGNRVRDRLEPTKTFSVATARIGGNRLWATPFYTAVDNGSLEDFFTLCHQNMLVGLSQMSGENSINVDDLSGKVKDLCDGLSKLVLYDNGHNKMEASKMGVEFDYPIVRADFTLPSSSHGIAYQLETDLLTNKSTIDCEIHLSNNSRRVDDVIMTLLEGQLGMDGVKFQREPYYDFGSHTLKFKLAFDSAEVDVSQIQEKLTLAFHRTTNTDMPVLNSVGGVEIRGEKIDNSTFALRAVRFRDKHPQLMNHILSLDEPGLKKFSLHHPYNNDVLIGILTADEQSPANKKKALIIAEQTLLSSLGSISRVGDRNNYDLYESTVGQAILALRRFSTAGGELQDETQRILVGLRAVGGDWLLDENHKRNMQDLLQVQ